MDDWTHCTSRGYEIGERCIDPAYCAKHGCVAGDADVAALRAENARLREALRARVLLPLFSYGSDNMQCCLCNGEWPDGQPERHAPGCLAA